MWRRSIVYAIRLYNKIFCLLAWVKYEDTGAFVQVVGKCSEQDFSLDVEGSIYLYKNHTVFVKESGEFQWWFEKSIWKFYQFLRKDGYIIGPDLDPPRVSTCWVNMTTGNRVQYDNNCSFNDPSYKWVEGALLVKQKKKSGIKKGVTTLLSCLLALGDFLSAI